MQELSGVLTPFHTLKSQMNPVVLRYFTELQKPTQMSFAGEPVPEKQDFVCCADARGSRSNPLFNRNLPLPIYSPAAQPEPVDANALETWQWQFVDVGDRYDLSGVTVLQKIRPYDGAHVYPVDVIPYMLDAGIIVLDDIKFGLRPCRTYSIDKLQRFAEIMRACVREACKTCRVKGRDVDILEKNFLLRFIGWMNMGGQPVWSLTQSMYQSDAPDGNVTKTTYPDGHPMVMHMPTDLVDNRTWLDKGLIALYVEQMRMGQLWNALNKYVTDWAAPLITIHGGHIDGIFYTSKLMDEEMIDDDLRQFTLTNGEPAFQIKRDSKHTIPSLPQKVTKPKDMPCGNVEPVWRICKETEFRQERSSGQRPENQRDAHLPSVAQHIVQNGGALLTGPAGVGKTVLVNMVKDLILAEDENAQIVVAALTHVAARLVQGSTIAHILHKHTTMTGGWFFLDEISMIPLSMWGDISRWQLMGNRFILVGEFDGQLAAYL